MAAICPAKALLAHRSSPGPPGLRLVHRPGARRAGYAGPLKPTVATRRLNYSPVGLERLRAADHHARISPALPDGPLTRTRSSDRSLNRNVCQSSGHLPMARSRTSGSDQWFGAVRSSMSAPASCHLAAHREHRLRHVFAELGVPDRPRWPPWSITRSGDVLAAGRRHNRAHAVRRVRRSPAARPD